MSRVILTHPEDLDEAGPSTLARVLQALKVLRDDPQAGERMEPLKPWQRFAVRDMTEWMYYRVPGSVEGEYRIIYRPTEEGDVLILAIGPRLKSVVYQRAAERLAKAETSRREIKARRRREHGKTRYRPL